MPLVQVFAKPPVAGKVKTRLLKDIGAHAATEVYRYCLKHTLQVVYNTNLACEIWLSETCADSTFANHQCQLQQGVDLGERMLFALSQSLDTSSDESVLLIGSDCLDLEPDHLDSALKSLENHDLVFLPCIDGGFAMIGCRRIEPSLFDQVTWSSETVLDQTLRNAKKLRLSVDLLETVRDIDTLQDLNHYPELRELIATQ